MISKSAGNLAVAVSVKVYQALLIAYPQKFRQEYGTHMLQVFQDGCARSIHRMGVVGVIDFWMLTVFDFLVSLISEHSQKDSEMTKTNLIRFSGWVLILGAILFLPSMMAYSIENSIWGYYAISYFSSNTHNILVIGGFVYPILIAIGLLGLWARYGRVVGFMRHVLLLGTLIGIGTFVLTDLIQILTFNFSIVRMIHLYTFLGGVLVMFIGLFIFGVFAQISKPMPRWNWAALVAGGAWVGVAPILVWMLQLHSSSQNPVPFLVMNTGYIVSTIALVMLGMDLQSNTDQEIIVTA